MATATINGKPSIFQTPEAPTAGITTDYATRIDDFFGIATEMATDDRTDDEWLADPEVQSELNAWYAAQDTPEAFEAYDAWVTEQETEAFEAHLCSQFDAEVAEMASFGDAYAKDLNSCDEFHGGAI